MAATGERTTVHVIQEYAAKSPEELSIRRGDKLSLRVSDIDKLTTRKWFVGTSSTGAQGLVPCDSVTLDASVEEPKAGAASSGRHKLFRRKSSTNDRPDKTTPSPSKPAPLSTVPGCNTAKVNDGTSASTSKAPVSRKESALSEIEVRSPASAQPSMEMVSSESLPLPSPPPSLSLPLPPSSATTTPPTSQQQLQSTTVVSPSSKRSAAGASSPSSKRPFDGLDRLESAFTDIDLAAVSIPPPIVSPKRPLKRVSQSGPSGAAAIAVVSGGGSPPPIVPTATLSLTSSSSSGGRSSKGTVRTYAARLAGSNKAAPGGSPPPTAARAPLGSAGLSVTPTAQEQAQIVERSFGAAEANAVEPLSLSSPLDSGAEDFLTEVMKNFGESVRHLPPKKAVSMRQTPPTARPTSLKMLSDVVGEISQESDVTPSTRHDDDFFGSPNGAAHCVAHSADPVADAGVFVDQPYDSQVWYHGRLSLVQATDMLLKHDVGAFLLRSTGTDNNDAFVLSVKAPGRVRHVNVLRNGNGGYRLVTRSFSTLPELIAFHIDESVRHSQTNTGAAGSPSSSAAGTAAALHRTRTPTSQQKANVLHQNTSHLYRNAPAVLLLTSVPRRATPVRVPLVRQQRVRRVIRIYLSAPVEGLERERDHFVGEHVPALRRLCESVGNGVQLVFTDLRWNVERGGAASSITALHTSLSDVRRSDIFVGVLGARYGPHGFANDWLQSNFDELCSDEQFAWANGLRNCSLTEVEFLSGHLRRPGQRPAIFMFRDPDFDRREYERLMKRGDRREAAKYDVEGIESASRLADLKHRVLVSHPSCAAVYDGYTDPMSGMRLLASEVEAVIRDMLVTRDIEPSSSEMSPANHAMASRERSDVSTASTLPGGEAGANTTTPTAAASTTATATPAAVASPLDSESVSHESFVCARSIGYVGRTHRLDNLQGAIEASHGGLVVLGPAGIGKSSLLANWVTRELELTAESSDIEVLYHFVGSAPHSRSHLNLMRRLTRRLRCILGHGSREALPVDTEKLMLMFSESLHHVASAPTLSRVVVVLDGLDQLENVDGAHTLEWLPDVVKWCGSGAAARIQLVVATQPGDIRNVLVRDRSWKTLHVSKLTESECREVIASSSRVHGRRLTLNQVERVVGHERTGNPLFLSILLNEIACYTDRDTLDEHLNKTLATTSNEDLFILMLERVGRSLYFPNTGLAKRRASMAHDAAGGNTEHSAESLTTSIAAVGRSTSSDSVGESSAPPSSALRRGLRRLSLKALTSSSSSASSSSAATAGLSGSGSWSQSEPQALAVILRSLAVAHYGLSEPELMAIANIDQTTWLPIFFSIEPFIMQRGDVITLAHSQLQSAVRRHFFHGAGVTAPSSDVAPPEKEMTAAYNTVAVFFEEELRRGTPQTSVRRVAEELPWLLESMDELKRLQRCLTNLDVFSYLVKNAKHDLSRYWLATNASPSAILRTYMDVLKRAERRDTSLLEMATHYSDVGTFLWSAGHVSQAVAPFESCLKIRQQVHGTQGKHSGRLAVSCNDLATVYKALAQYPKAQDKFEMALSIWEKKFGGDHSYVAMVLTSLAEVYEKQSKFGLAMSCAQRSLMICEKHSGAADPSVAVALINLAAIHESNGQYHEAEPLYQRALHVRQDYYGDSHPQLAEVYMSLASLLRTKGNYVGSLSAYEKALFNYEHHFGPKHPKVIESLVKISQVLECQGRFKEANQVSERARALENDDVAALVLKESSLV